jgi:hypothetical protein
MDACAAALADGTPVSVALPISNVDRTVGTLLGSEISRRYGAAGLPDDTISLTFTGSAGQSFGAFVPRGVTMRLYGDANDYFGKGLSGGRLIVRPPVESPSPPRSRSSPATSSSTGPPAARSSSGARWGSASACATRAPSPWSRAWATTAAST